MKKKDETKIQNKKPRKPLSRRAKIIIIVVIAAIAAAFLAGILFIHQKTGGSLELVGKNLDIKESSLFKDVDTGKITKAEIYMNAGTLKGQTITLTKEDQADELSKLVKTFFRSGNRYGTADSSSLEKDAYEYRVTFAAGDTTVNIWYYNTYTLRIQGGYYYQAPAVNNDDLNDILDRYYAKDHYDYFP
jgi:hypothetical protein